MTKNEKKDKYIFKKISEMTDNEKKEEIESYEKKGLKECSYEEQKRYMNLCGTNFKQEPEPKWLKEQVKILQLERDSYYDQGYFTTDDKFESLDVKEDDPEEGWDFVDYFIETVNMRTDAHKHFKEMIALYLISTLTTWRFKLLDIDLNSMNLEEDDYLPLNIWVMLIGTSRLARKSTVVNVARKLLDRILEERTVTNNRIRPIQTYQVNAMLPDNFTPEALVSSLTDRCWERFSGSGSIGERTHASWVNDEVSGFWVKLSKQDFMSGTPELMAKIYDCPKTYRAATVRRGQEAIRFPYLTILTASTEVLPKFFDELQLRQGFLNRYFFVISRDRPLVRDKMDDYDERYKAIFSWLDYLYKVKAPITMGFIDPTVEKVYKKYELDNNKRLIEDYLGINKGWISNLPQFIRKIATLFRISRIKFRELESYRFIPDTLSIEMQDWKRAIKVVKYLEEDFNETIALAKTKYVESSIYVVTTAQVRLFNILQKLAKKTTTGWVLWSDILRRASIRAATLEEQLDDMYAAGYIDRQQRKTKTKYATYYKPVTRPIFQ